MDPFVVRDPQEPLDPDLLRQRGDGKPDQAAPQPHGVGGKEDVLRGQEGVLLGGAATRSRPHNDRGRRPVEEAVPAGLLPLVEGLAHRLVVVPIVIGQFPLAEELRPFRRRGFSAIRLRPLKNRATRSPKASTDARSGRIVKVHT